MTVQLAPSIVFQSFLPTGAPNAFGNVFTYIAGTATPQATYPDSTQGTPNPNPVPLNALGQASIWLATNLTYKIIVQDALGNQINFQDQIIGGQNFSGIQLSGVYGTDSGAVNAYVFTHAASTPVTSLAVGTLIRFIPLNTNTGASTLNADGTGAVAIIRANGSALTGGEFSSLGPVVLQSTGTQWQIVSTAGAQPGFERTAGEVSAGVIPADYRYLSTNIQRYGPDLTGVAVSATAIQNGINANVGGQLNFPFGTYNLGNAASAILLPAGGVRLTGNARNGVQFNYSGTGVAIDGFANSAQNWCLEHFTLNCTNDAGTGIKAGNASQHQEIDDLAIFGTSTATSTGTGLLLDAGTPGSFSGNLSARLFYVAGMKFGVRVVGHSLGSNTWTSMTFIHCFLIGRSAGIITGSKGFWMDSLTNGVGSCYLGGTIESYDVALQVDTGGYGIDLASDIEGNNTNFGGGSVAGTLGSTFAGRVKLTNANGNDYEASVNAAANRWYQRQQLSGFLDEETYRDQRHTIYDGGAADQQWAIYRGTEAQSFISGTGTPTKKFAVNMAVGSSNSFGHHYIFLNGQTVHWDIQSPQTAGIGTWTAGDFCFNANINGTGIIGWYCTVSGTPGTWASLGLLLSSASTGWGAPIGNAVINNYNITDAGGANSNTNKALAQIIVTLKAYGILAA